MSDVSRIDSGIDLSIVLACYCENGHLEPHVDRIVEYLQASRLRFELIFVEDGSPDDTREAVERAAQGLRNRRVPVRTIFHEVNRGRGASVQDGFQVARGTVVGFFDLDLENRLDVLMPMYQRIASGECDGVVGRRVYADWSRHPFRVALSLTNRWLMRRLLSLPVSDPETGFKLFRRERLLPVLPFLKDERWFWDTEIVARSAAGGLRLVDHGVIFERSPTKRSTVRLFRDSARHMKALLRYLISDDRNNAVDIPNEGIAANYNKGPRAAEAPTALAGDHLPPGWT